MRWPIELLMFSVLSIPLLTLALAAFAIGTTEFIIQGLLPEIATDLEVSIPAAGLLVTAFAFGIAIGSPILAILIQRLSPRTALICLMGSFVVGHILCAIAPDYPVLMTARIVSSFCVGSFFGIGSVVAADLAPRGRQASGVALMWAGIAAANVVGVPVGTALGQALGWRSTFWAVAMLGLISMAAMALWLPNTGSPGRPGRASEFRVLRRPEVLLAIALSVLICTGALVVFAFIAPLLQETSDISSSALPGFLLVFGVGGVIGMQVGGRAADRSTNASIVGVFLALFVIYLAQLVTLRSAPAAAITIFVWGFAFYFPATAIQIRVIKAAHEAPNLASTLVHSGFNLGTALGPIIGAAVLTVGFTYAALPAISAALAVVGLSIALWSTLRGQWKSPTPAREPNPDDGRSSQRSPRRN